MSWKNHIDQIILKLSTACYAIRYLKPFMYQNTIRKIYFHIFIPSFVRHNFWGNSAFSTKNFKILKRIIRIIMNARNRDFCHQLFMKLKILPINWQYIFPFHYLLPKTETYMNQNHKFIISTPDLVLTYIPQLQT